MSGARAILARLILVSAPAFLFYGCGSPSSTLRCVFETGGMASGRCLTQCESQCSLEAAARCAPKDCVGRCEEEQKSVTTVCADARYARWRCLRGAALPRVTCADGSPSLETPSGVCEAELGAMVSACSEKDAGRSDARETAR